jgi:hypothetical protein
MAGVSTAFVISCRIQCNCFAQSVKFLNGRKKRRLATYGLNRLVENAGVLRRHAARVSVLREKQETTLIGRVGVVVECLIQST